MSEQKKLRNESLQKMVEDAVKYQEERLAHYKLTKINVGESYHKERTRKGNKIMIALVALRDEVLRLEKENEVWEEMYKEVASELYLIGKENPNDQ